MPLEQLIAQGRVFWVAQMRTMGYAREHILGLLRRDFPGELEVTRVAVYNRGERSMAAADALSRMADAERITARHLPRDPLGGTGWVYLVYANWRDPATGQSETRTVPIHADASLTLGELRQRVFALAEWMRETALSRGRSPPIDDPFVLTDMDILSVQRE